MTMFTEHTLNFDLYRQEMAYWSDTLIDYKYNTLRTPHYLQPAKVSYIQVETITAKKLVTLMCSLRAHHRGKVHQQRLTLEEQEAFIRDNWSKISHLLTEREDEEVVEQAA
jgi:hypothetical protein